MILQENVHNFDVAILGNGLSGSMLAAVLARHGVSVVLIDAEVHPRFAVGESTIPHTSLLISLIADKYDVPELDYLVNTDRLADHVCTTCGIKRSFGYVFHREGKTYEPREGLQFGTSAKDENHWFRQDIDAYLFNLAIHYGAVPRQKTKVTSLEIDEQGVRLLTSAGEEIHARYVVDGTGHKSIVADRFGLRENPTRLKPLHHCFERGWFWVIPFNNHERSTNPLISIGLTIDPRRYPKPEMAAEQEFQQFLEKYPSVAEQFATGKAVRPWVSTGRLQYSSRQTTGYRFCLMSHAAGFVDPLFSRGMVNTVEVIYGLIDPLLHALATDNFDQEGFAHIDRLQQRVLDYNDQMVNCAFISWADFDLWNAWLRVFAIGTFLAEFRLMNAMSDYSESRADNCLAGDTQNPVFSNFEDPDYAAFFSRSVELVEAFEAGRISSAHAAKGIFDITDEYEFPVLIRRDGLIRAGWIKEEDYLIERDLRFVRNGLRWAITTPHTRDMVSSSQTFFRWCAHRPDPHLVEAAPAR